MTVYRQAGDNGSSLGAQRSGGERSEPERSGAPNDGARPAPPSTEVTERPIRRQFTAAYKLSIVQEADRCTEFGQIGAMLRREGLYHSHLDKWRKLRASGDLESLTPRKRGPKSVAPNLLSKEIEQLRRENAKLEKKLKKAQLVIEFQKKVAALLKMPLDETDDEGSA
jgi:transposase-like protein